MQSRIRATQGECVMFIVSREMSAIAAGFVLFGLATFSMNSGARAERLLAQVQNPAASVSTPDGPGAQAAWAACSNVPTRRCVLDEALRIAQSTKAASDRPF